MSSAVNTTCNRCCPRRDERAYVSLPPNIVTNRRNGGERHFSHLRTADSALSLARLAVCSHGRQRAILCYFVGSERLWVVFTRTRASLDVKNIGCMRS